MSKPEIYVSIDVETNGPCPGVYSMLALGAVAFSPGGAESPWYATLEPLYGALGPSGHPDTMAWWKTQPEAWAEVTTNQQDPEPAMENFVAWVDGLPGKPIAVAWPAAFDFAFASYYCHRFAGRNPLGFSCLDIRSYANGLAGYTSYYGLSEKHVRSMAGDVDESGLQDHNALDDAIGQGRLFMQLRQHAATLSAQTGQSQP